LKCQLKVLRCLLKYAGGSGFTAYAKPGDAGMDVCAAEDVIIRPEETVIIPTGLKLAIPEGYEIQVRPEAEFHTKPL
jgi:dUTPase